MTVRTVTEVEVYNYYSDENAEWLVAPCSPLSGVRLIPVWRCGISMLPYGCTLICTPLEELLPRGQCTTLN